MQGNVAVSSLRAWLQYVPVRRPAAGASGDHGGRLLLHHRLAVARHEAGT